MGSPRRTRFVPRPPNWPPGALLGGAAAAERACDAPRSPLHAAAPQPSSPPGARRPRIPDAARDARQRERMRGRMVHQAIGGAAGEVSARGEAPAPGRPPPAVDRFDHDPVAFAGACKEYTRHKREARAQAHAEWAGLFRRRRGDGGGRPIPPNSPLLAYCPEGPGPEFAAAVCAAAADPIDLGPVDQDPFTD